jgi:carboxylesterase type B
LENVAPTVLLAEQLHCSPNDLACFRSRSADEIITAQAKVNLEFTSLNPLFFFEPWLPVIDNDTVYGTLVNTVQNVSFPLKPLIIGTLTDECFDMIHVAWKKNVTVSEYIGLAIGLFGEKAVKILEHYPPLSSDDQRPNIVRIATEWIFTCSTRVFARKAATYSYVFGYPNNTVNSLNCVDHACHADELPYIFESFWERFTDIDRYISHSMATYWTNFAKSENPNDPSSVPLSWPKFTDGNETYMFIQNPFQLVQNYVKDDCDLWDQIGYK